MIDSYVCAVIGSGGDCCLACPYCSPPLINSCSAFLESLSITANIFFTAEQCFITYCEKYLQFSAYFPRYDFICQIMNAFYHPLSSPLSPLLISVSLGSLQVKKASISHSVILSWLPTAPPSTPSTLIHHLISVQSFMCLCCACVCGPFS